VKAHCVGLAETEARVEVAGAVNSFTPTTIVSVDAAVEGKFNVIGVVDQTPERAGAGVTAAMLETISCRPFALAGATDVRTPKPKAATVTSAMRL